MRWGGTPAGPSRSRIASTLPPYLTLPTLLNLGDYLLSSNMTTSVNGQNGTIEDGVPPDYMNEHVFQRNRLPPRAYFLPAEHLSLSGKWRFHYASSPLEPEPELMYDDAWGLIDVPGKLLSDVLDFSFAGQPPQQLVTCRRKCLGMISCCHFLREYTLSGDS